AARKSVGPMRLFTRFAADLPTALHFQAVLEAIRERVAAAARGLGRPEQPAARPRFAEGAFRAALLQEPGRRGLDAARDMGLCFVASVGARRWVGRELRTPRFGAHDLDAGLSSWRRLREARARLKAGEAEHAASAAWRRLREVYLDIWAEA
ncbi:unnamed protein product, partial [Prorocentrum cordatum]